MAWLNCVWIWITDHTTVLATVVSALATIAIAIFTVCLSRVTGRLAALANATLVTTERAFVYLEGFEIDIGQTTHPRDPNDPLFITRFIVKPKWKNSGTTPARNLTVRVNFTITIGNPPVEYSYGNSGERLFLGPQASAMSSFQQLPTGSAQEIVGLREAGQTNLFIWGRAEYEDMFGDTQPHFTQWCYRVHLGAPDGKTLRAEFIQAGNYNCSDADADIKDSQ